jgi:hypothetical protein
MRRPPASAEARVVRTIECLLNAVLLTGVGPGMTGAREDKA